MHGPNALGNLVRRDLVIGIIPRNPFSQIGPRGPSSSGTAGKPFETAPVHCAGPRLDPCTNYLAK